MGPARPHEPGKDLPVTLRRALATLGRGELDLPDARRAAVLVPLIDRDGGPGIVFTLRSLALRAHGGQWAFPGGRVDDGDAHATAAALREAEEEIGIDPAAVEVLGLLSEVATSTGFVVTPVVGWISPPPGAYRPNPAEVAELVETPLARLLAPGAVTALGGGYTLEGRTIWGATARIVAELARLVTTIVTAR